MANPFDTYLQNYPIDGGMSNTPPTSTGSLVEDKKQNLVQATNTKKYNLADPNDLRQAAVDSRAGTVIPDNNQFMNDLSNLSNTELFTKYGEDVAANRWKYLTERRDLELDLNAPVTAQDAALGVAQGTIGTIGALNTLGGMAADTLLNIGPTIANKFGIDARRSNLAGNIAGSANRASEYLQSLNTEALQTEKQARSEVLSSMTKANKEKYSDGTTLGELARIGSDIYDAAGNILESPSMTADTVGQGVGSLVVGTPLVRAGAALGTVAGLSRGASIGGAGAVNEMLQGAGGAAMQTYQDVENTPVTQLLMNNPDYLPLYNDLRSKNLERGMNEFDASIGAQNEAKDILAQNAANISAAVVSPVSAILGRVTANFDYNPTAISGSGTLGKLASIGRNAVTQTTEEGLQGGSEQLGTNIGVQVQVDPTRELAEGVGEAVAQEAIGGLGTVGVAQGPGTLLSSSKEAIQKGRDLVSKGVKTVSDYRAKQLDEESPTGQKATQENVDRLNTEILPEVTSVTETLSQAPETAPIADRINRAIYASPEELNLLPESVRTNLPEGNPTRWDIIVNSVEAAQTLEGSEKTDALIALSQMFNSKDILVSEEMADYVNNLPEGDTTKDLIGDLVQTIQVISSNDSLRSLIQEAHEITKENVSLPETIDDSNVDTSSTKIQAVSRLNPEAVDVEKANLVLQHLRDRGDDPSSYAGLDEAINYSTRMQSITEEKKALQEAIKKINPKSKFSPSNLVSENINEVSNGSKVSLNEHRAMIQQAVENGQLSLALDALNELGNFATSMRNKVAALNRSYRDSRDEKYQSYNPDQKVFYESTKPVRIHKDNPNSYVFAKDVAIDANAVIDTYNNLLDAYGSMLPDEGSQLPKRKNVKLIPEVDQYFNNKTLSEETVKTPNENIENKPVSRITSEQAASLSDSSLKKRLDNLLSKENRTDEDEATLDVLKGEAKARDAINDSEDTNDVKDVPVQEKSTETNRSSLREEATNTPEEVILTDNDQNTNNNQIQNDEVTEESNRNTTDITEEVETLSETSTIDLNNVLPINGRNVFTETFKVKKNGSRLNTPNPMEKVLGDLGSNKINTEAANKFDRSVNQEEIKTYRNLIDVFNTTILDHINDRFAKVFDDKKIRSYLDKGTNLLKRPNTRHLTMMQEDGVLNQDLLQTALLASINWINKFDTSTFKKDAEDVSKILGIPQDQVTEDQIQFFNYGMGTEELKESLGREITKFWGVQGNPNISDDLVKGIPIAIGSEIILSLLDQKLLEVKPLKFNGKDYNAYRINPEFKENTLNDLSKFPDLLEQAYIPESEKVRYIGTPPQKVAQTQLRNTRTKLSKREKDLIKDRQEAAYTPNVPFINFIRAIGKDAYLAIRGYQDVSNPEMYNQEHLKSIEGKNLSLSMGWDNTIADIEAMEAYSQEHNIPFEEVERFYDWDITRVGRLQMRGFGPQSDKLARESITITNTEIDLGNKDQTDAMWLAIGQSVGLKTEKSNHKTLIQEAKNMFFEEDGKFYTPTEVVYKWLERTKGNEPMNEDELHEFTSIGSGLTDKELHAVVAVAHSNYTLTHGDPSKFKFSLALEADGKTDGPANAIMNFIGGTFNKNQLANMRKIGFFPNKRDMTLNEYATVDDVDLYGSGANTLITELGDLKTKILKDHKNVSSYFGSLHRFLNEFLKDYKIENTENGPQLIIGRGVLKNPLTITVYGSGLDGINSKIADAVFGTIYEQMSQLAQFRADDPRSSFRATMSNQNYNELPADLSRLFSHRLMRNKEGEYYIRKIGSVPNINGDPTKFEFTVDQKENFKSFLKDFFTIPMDQSINSIVGDARSNVKLFQEATQVQSIYLQDMFQKKMDEMIKANNGMALSQNQINEIYKELEAFGATVETDAQTFNMSTRDTSLRDHDYGRTLNDSLSSSASMELPSHAGVRAAPYITIGTGDGRMVMNIYTGNNQNIQATLPVFDGIEIDALKAKDASVEINKSVYDAWQNNPAQNVYDSFKRFMDALDPNYELSPEASKAMERVYSDNEHIVNMQNTLGSLDQLTKTIDARKKALFSIQSSTDHMASAEGPYTAKGDDLGNISDDLLVEELNNRYRYFLDDSMDIQDKVEVDNPIKMIGYETPSKSLIVTINDVAKMINSQGTNEQKLIFRDIKNFIDPNTKIVHGSKDEITKYLSDLGNQTYIDIFGNALGFYASVDDLVISSNEKSVETLLHELVHASTIKKVLNYYNNESTSSDTLKSTFRSLENMLQDIMAIDDPSSEGLNTLKSVINDFLSNGKTFNDLDIFGKTQVINELLAYGLTSPENIKTFSNTKASTLSRMKAKIIKAIKDILGIKGNVGTDLFSNLRFYNQVVLRSEAIQNNPFMILQSIRPIDKRLQDLQDRFIRRLPDSIQGSEINRVTSLDASAGSIHELNTLIGSGFKFNDQQQNVFKLINAAFNANLRIDPKASQRAQDIFSYAMKHLDVSDFYEYKTNTPQWDMVQAQEKYDSLFGRKGTNDKFSNSHLGRFIALGMVDDRLREALKNMPIRKSDKLNWTDSVDSFVESVGTSVLNAMDDFGNTTSTRNVNTLNALDQVVESIAKIKQDDQFELEQINRDFMDNVDAWISNKMTQVTDTISDKASLLSEKYQPKTLVGNIGKVVINAVDFAARAASKNKAEGAAESITSLLNQENVPHLFRDLWADIRTRTESNKEIVDLLTKVKDVVSRSRQQTRTDIPVELTKRFKKEPTKKQWTDMFYGIGKTDLSNLVSSYSLNTIRGLFNENNLNNEIKKLESNIRKEDPKNFNYYKKQSEDLAHYMITGENRNSNLLRNADAISNMLGSNKKNNPSDDLTKNIDNLISMYAIKNIEPATRAKLNDLMTTEVEGINTILTFMYAQNKSEKAKSTTRFTKFNSWKGYIPSENQKGMTLRIADKSNHKEMLMRGYTHVGDYSSNEGYYLSSTAGLNTFGQGVMQTAQFTVGGIDPQTGKSVTGNTGGLINRNDVHLIKAFGGDTKILPIYNENGDLVSYERLMDPKYVASLNKNTNLSEMIGAWAGRQVEEVLAQQFNKQLVDEMYDLYQNESATKDDEYFNIFDSKDPIHKETVNVIPREMKDYIESKFGSKVFMVRRDLFNNALGRREASVADLWTGKSRWSPESQKTTRDVFMAIMGKDAFRYLVTAEKALQQGVGFAKNTIVVRSIVVPAVNIASNVVQLNARGVSFGDILRGTKEKTLELNKYIEWDNRIRSAQVELRHAEINNPIQAKRLNQEIESLYEAIKRLSIYPLIQRGEFSSIEDGVVDVDAALKNGKWTDYVEGYTNKLPEGLKTFGKNALISKDTALNKGLARVVQYGDFIAKAVYYDHLTRRQGMSDEVAYGKVSDEFINYNLMAGRDRSYLESIGICLLYTSEAETVP